MLEDKSYRKREYDMTEEAPPRPEVGASLSGMLSSLVGGLNVPSRITLVHGSRESWRSDSGLHAASAASGARCAHC